MTLTEIWGKSERKSKAGYENQGSTPFTTCDVIMTRFPHISSDVAGGSHLTLHLNMAPYFSPLIEHSFCFQGLIDNSAPSCIEKQRHRWSKNAYEGYTKI